MQLKNQNTNKVENNNFVKHSKTERECFDSNKQDFEDSVESLKNKNKLNEYIAKYYGYDTSLIPSVLGTILVFCGNLFYGREPSYAKFRAVEVIARVPYQSWSSAAYTLLTMFYANEKKALELAGIKRFARLAMDNETMHVVVISHLALQEKKRFGFFRFTLIPMLFAFFYFWASYTLFLLNRKWSYELNYLFEDHAFHQYTIFINRYGDRLAEKPINSDYLKFYGREVKNQYEFFESVRNDEIIHRNESIDKIDSIHGFNYRLVLFVIVMYILLTILF